MRFFEIQMKMVMKLYCDEPVRWKIAILITCIFNIFRHLFPWIFSILCIFGANLNLFMKTIPFDWYFDWLCTIEALCLRYKQMRIVFEFITRWKSTIQAVITYLCGVQFYCSCTLHLLHIVWYEYVDVHCSDIVNDWVSSVMYELYAHKRIQISTICWKGNVGEKENKQQISTKI